VSAGFTVDLNEAAKACSRENGSLPEAATMLRVPIADVLAYDPLETKAAPADLDVVQRMQGQYHEFCKTIGDRQIRACNIMDDTAEALREIIEVYRRVDGQYQNRGA
jgi:hypothetical protein